VLLKLHARRDPVDITTLFPETSTACNMSSYYDVHHLYPVVSRCDADLVSEKAGGVGEVAEGYRDFLACGDIYRDVRRYVDLSYYISSDFSVEGGGGG